MMALGESPLLWGASRYLAGLSSAAGLMLGSGLILNWLLRHGHRAELGLHFSGLGLGIVLGALLVELAAPVLDWQQQWWLLTAAGALLILPAWHATFTVLITEQQPALAGQGGLMWLLVGLAAAPAPILWDRIARRLGYLRALTIAYLMQIVGILLPVLSGSLTCSASPSSASSRWC